MAVLWLLPWAMLLGFAPSASALTPAAGVTYPNGTAVEGECGLNAGAADTERRFWVTVTIDPKRAHGGSQGGVSLAPASLPRLEVMGDGVTDEFSAAPYPEGDAGFTNPDECLATSLSFDTDVLGASVLLSRPGPYVFMQHDFKAHWAEYPDSGTDPTPAPCGTNDNVYYPAPQTSVPSAAPASGFHWAVETFCNDVTVTPFYVGGDGGLCPANGDMTQWPAVGYINQYDAGARLGLPTRFGFAGGNASGPASLLMALLRTGAPVAPTLGDAFDATMQHTRATVAPNGRNTFVQARAVAYLKSLGFRQARVLNLGTSSNDANLQNIATLYQEVAARQPVLVSTAFGTGRWGLTGGGHMIAVIGIKNGNFLVLDPAGNYFGSPSSHYGQGKCGYGVTYPVAWMKAFIVGRSLVHIGAYTAPAPALPARSSNGPTGTSLSVMDAHPESADNPGTFYLQDPLGRRAGFINGAVVEEIPDAYVGKELASWADPASGDPGLDTDPAGPPPTARAIVVADPAAQTQLHVVADPGSTFALSVDGWRAGVVTAHDDLSGTGTGQDAPVPFTALNTLLNGPTPKPTPKPLTTAAVSRLAISPRAFRAAPSGPSARKAKSRAGARVTFRLNIAASVRFTVDRRSGRRFVHVPGAFTVTGRRGANTFRFTGRIGGHKLGVASYRLVAIPSVAKRAGAAARAAFRITAT